MNLLPIYDRDGFVCTVRLAKEVRHGGAASPLQERIEEHITNIFLLFMDGAAVLIQILDLVTPKKPSYFNGSYLKFL